MKRLTLVAGGALITAVVGGPTPAQALTPTFSIDFQGPSIGLPDSFGLGPITEGDVLTPALPGAPGPNPPGLGPLPPPGIFRTVPAILPSGPGIRELDALSYGHDPIRNTLLDGSGSIYFSVDEFATSFPGTTLPPPNVLSEGATGATEASADVYRSPSPGFAVPPPPPVGAPGNTLAIDGDGLPSPVPTIPGLGLADPNPPMPHALPDNGDNLDALDVDTTFNDRGGPLYLSLDSGFIGPLEVPPANAGTALANGFVGGDVLVEPVPGAGLILYATAAALGLDLAGPDSDDLDALLVEEVDGVLEQFAPGIDFIAFSVRRGSAVIGSPDSLFGVPIEEGDILTLPTPGGASPFPSLLVPAEWMGLATARSGTATGHFGPLVGDDLDALDVTPVPEPTSLALVATLLAGIVVLRRRAI